MNVAIFAYSRQGCRTAERVMDFFPEERVAAYTVPRLRIPGFREIEQPSKDFYGRIFSWADAMIFVGSCGIAVRQIAPHLKSKTTDPAVLVLDELGTFVISLLSGHMGGANRLAQALAGHLKATPVVTTATDRNGKFSVDAWAAEQGYTLSSMQAAKAVSAAILEGPVGISGDFPLGTLPAGVEERSSGPVGIYLGFFKNEPFDRTLRVIPRVLHLGIGCRKNTPEEDIRLAVCRVLAANRIDSRSIRCAASIDLKQNEPGLLAYCKAEHLPVSFYSADALRQVPGEFTPSAFVASVTGVDNVCERAALLGAQRLIVKKTALNGVTVALAAEKLEVQFG